MKPVNNSIKTVSIYDKKVWLKTLITRKEPPLGVRIIMGTAAAQAVCFPIEVIIDLQELGEKRWQEARGKGRVTYSRAEMMLLQDVACSTTFAVLYTMTACRPGELGEMRSADLRHWIQRQRCSSEMTSWIEVSVGDRKTEQTGDV